MGVSLGFEAVGLLCRGEGATGIYALSPVQTLMLAIYNMIQVIHAVVRCFQ